MAVGKLKTGLAVLGCIILLWVSYRILVVTLQTEVFDRIELQSMAPTGLSGTFSFSAFGKGTSESKALRHSSIIVRDMDYRAMEDNDLRGFLDGAFKNGWNQPSQTHVRVGRRGPSTERSYLLFLNKELVEIPGFSNVLQFFELPYPYLAEHELFRVLYRWSELPIPARIRIEDASFQIFIEKSPSSRSLVYLYAVNKDWSPGGGGIHRDNTSPPKSGEVWWRDVGFEVQPWGLPGVNFAADDNPNADTPGQPLAHAWVSREDETIIFHSNRLTQYIGARIEKQDPLLFLVKLSDYFEDTPNSRFSIYSANYGDDRNTSYRPRLYLQWSGREEIYHESHALNIEYGREYVFKKIELPRSVSTYYASFDSEPGFEDPFIQVRGGNEELVSDWNKLDGKVQDSWRWVQFKISGVLPDPIVLGGAFRSQLRDTWVPSGTPESQEVRCLFLSPSGKVSDQQANLIGDFTWQVRFVPNEIGRWHYFWRHEFTGKLAKRNQGVFDVRGGDSANLEIQLRKFVQEIDAANFKTHYERMNAFEGRFARLERAVMQTRLSESNGAPENLRQLLTEARSLIWNKVIPEALPFESYDRE